jgi:hypothetical protein
MTVRLLFALPAALRLAEHAVAAPTYPGRPGTALVNTPALRLIIEDLAGQPPVVYLARCGTPCLATSDGGPACVYAEAPPRDLDSWLTEAHEVFDLNQLVPAGTITAGRLPIARGWYLPLRPPTRRPVIEALRAASAEGYTHLSIDAPSLTVGVFRRRHRQPHRAGRCGTRAVRGVAPGRVVRY